MRILGKNSDFLHQKHLPCIPIDTHVLFFQKEGIHHPNRMGGIKEQPWKDKTGDELASLSPDHLLSMAEQAEQLGEDAQYDTPKTGAESIAALRMHELHTHVLAEDEKAKATARKQIEHAIKKEERLTQKNQEKVIIDPTIYEDAFFHQGDTGQFSEKAVTTYQTQEADEVWQKSIEPVTKKIGRFFKKLFKRT